MPRRSSVHLQDGPLAAQVRRAAAGRVNQLGPHAEGWMLVIEEALRRLASDRRRWPATLELLGICLHLGWDEAAQPRAVEQQATQEEEVHVLVRPALIRERMDAMNNRDIEQAAQAVEQFTGNQQLAIDMAAACLLTTACMAQFPADGWMVSGQDHGWWHARIERARVSSA